MFNCQCDPFCIRIPMKVTQALVKIVIQNSQKMIMKLVETKGFNEMRHGIITEVMFLMC